MNGPEIAGLWRRRREAALDFEPVAALTATVPGRRQDSGLLVEDGRLVAESTEKGCEAVAGQFPVETG